MKIAVLSAIWPIALERLRLRHDVAVELDPPPPVLHRTLSDRRAAVIRSPVRLDRAALEAAPALRLVVRAGAGTDAVDLACAESRGVRVVTVPSAARSVAEHAFGLLLGLFRGIPRLDRSLREGRWLKSSGGGRELRGKRLGLVGFGRIGRSLGELASAFGMQVAACDRSPEKPEKREAAKRLGVTFMGLDELLRESDAVCVQAPLDGGSRRLLDAAKLGLMKMGAVLVHVGRGGVVDEAALYAALREGRLAGAALDVFESEPPGESPLLSLDNFIGTPHVGAQTAEAQAAIGDEVVRILDEFALDKERP